MNSINKINLDGIEYQIGESKTSEKLSSKVVINKQGNIIITYSNNNYEEIIFSPTLITDILYEDSTKTKILETTNIKFNVDNSIDIEEI